MLHDTYTADMFTTTAKEQILACCIATLFLTKMENKYHKYAFHKWKKRTIFIMHNLVIQKGQKMSVIFTHERKVQSS
jgi:hypothetical protein